MFDNPIIQRYRFSQFRPQQLWVFGTLYILTLFLLFMINTSLYTMVDIYSSATRLYRNLFIQFSILQVFILWLFMPMNASNVVPREIADNSFDFFRMLPLSSTKKALGILIGRNLLSLAIAGINFCFWIILGVLGGLSFNMLLQWIVLILTVTLTLNVVSLLMSILSFHRTKSSSVPAFLILGIFAFGPLLGLISKTTRGDDISNCMVHVFTFRMPIMYLISLYVLIAGIWGFSGIQRRFSREYEPLFSRRGAFGFLACYLVMVYALYHSYLMNSGIPNDEAYFTFYFVTSVPLIGICLFSIRSFDKYIEILRSSGAGNNPFGKIFMNSNLLLGLLLVAVWAIAVGVVSVLCGYVPDYCKLTLYYFSALLVIFCLLEIYAVYFQTNEKISYLLIFAAILYLILPMILAGLFDNDYMAMFSPFGFVYSYETYNTLGEILPAVLLNIAFLIPLAVLILKRYARITQVRHHLA